MSRREAVLRNTRPKRILWCALLLLACWMTEAAEGAKGPGNAVPSPSEQSVNVVVSGRTSTLKSFDVKRVDNRIPETFSGKGVRNTPGFTWWVSRHWALKTDYDEKTARYFLELLELAYPHYVELFGREPEGIDRKRMTVVYASSKDKMVKAGRSDGLIIDIRGGGITTPKNKVAYQFPSGGLKYHKRYILLHECVHLFHMCLHGTLYNTPHWYFEGIADGLSHHVYDPVNKRLTFWVVDRAPTNDWYDQGLRQFKAEPQTFQELHDKGHAKRGKGFLMCAWLAHDPERLQKFRIWQDELNRFNQKSAKLFIPFSSLRMQELFGPWDKINADFKDWLGKRRHTYHYAEWGWEQDGEELWSHGFATKGKLSRTDIHLPLNEKPSSDPLVMDYLRSPASPLVGKVERGVAEPSVGALISFARTPAKGKAGLGFGVRSWEKPPRGSWERAGFLKVLVEGEKKLVIDGRDLGGKPKTQNLPKAMVDAIARGKHRFGMTVRVAAEELEIHLRATGPEEGKPEHFKATYPITKEQRDRILAGPSAVLSRGGRHGVIPYFDVPIRKAPDLTKTAPANRWRNPGDRDLEKLCRAEWRLKGRAPTDLSKLKARMLQAVTGSREDQEAALADLRKSTEKLESSIRACGASTENKDRAIAELHGIDVYLRLVPGDKGDVFDLQTTVCGAGRYESRGRLAFEVQADGDPAIEQPKHFALALKPGSRLHIRRVLRMGRPGRSFKVAATVKLAFQGRSLTLREHCEWKAPIAEWWVLGPLDNKGGSRTDKVLAPERDQRADLKKTYRGLGGKKATWRKARVEASGAVDLAALYGRKKNAAAYARVWIKSPKKAKATLWLGSDDGVVVWLNRKRVHTNLTNRGFNLYADKVPLELNEGSNALFIKVTQGGGGWKIGARLEPKSSDLKLETTLSDQLSEKNDD